MSFRDSIYYADAAPTLGQTLIRPFWFVEADNELWIWNVVAAAYAQYVPEVPPTVVPDATDLVPGIIALATQLEVTAGVVNNKAVTPETLFASFTALVGGAPTNLSTLDALAAAINDDPLFFQTVASSISGKANVSGANVSTPGVGSMSTALANTQYVQDVVEDTAVTPANVTDARSSVIVAGATNVAGKQRFVTLPAHDALTALVERVCTGLGGGSGFTMGVNDDVLLLDGAVGAPTLNIGNPALFKKKRYHIVCVNNANPPVLAFSPSFPLVNGDTSKILTAVGDTLTLVPTSLGRWAAV